MRIVLLALSLIAVSARGADTPLSAILIEGEGWKATKGGPPEAWSYNQKDAKGGMVLVLVPDDGRMDGQPLIIIPGLGETFGAAVMSPKKGQVVITVPSHHYLYTCQVAGRDLLAKEKCYVLRREKPGKGGSNVGTIAFDTKGRLFAAMPEGVQYFDEEMRFSGQLSRPERKPVTHVWFGGEKNDELFIVCGDKTWKRKVMAVGAK